MNAAICHAFQASLRDAGRRHAFRGLKPTATISGSLRDSNAKYPAKLTHRKRRETLKPFLANRSRILNLRGMQAHAIGAKIGRRWGAESATNQRLLAAYSI